MTCSCNTTCVCQETITKLEAQQLDNMRTILHLQSKLEALESKKSHMFPTNLPSDEEECLTCSA
jgi:hypothetical protein